MIDSTLYDNEHPPAADPLPAAVALFLRSTCPADFAPHVGIYVLRWSVAREFHQPPFRKFDAYSARDLDLLLRVPLAPVWHGRGFCCVLQDRYAEFAIGPRLNENLCRTFALVARECGHWLADAALSHDPATDETPHWTRGAAFIRATVHVWHRLQAKQAFPLESCGIIDGAVDCPASYFETALRDELRERGSERIADVMRTPAPQVFDELCASELNRPPE